MAAQTTLATKDRSAAVITAQPEGARPGMAEWRERNAVVGSAGDIVYTLTITDKADGKSPIREKFLTETPQFAADGVTITGNGSIMISLIAPANASDNFLADLYERASNAFLDANVKAAFKSRTKIW